MEKEQFKKEIEKYLEIISIFLTQKQIEQFYDYMNLLLEWNEKFNLTAITKPEEIILKHFIDSIIPINNIKKDSKIVDIGTGAGFPGIPLKIVRPDLKITLVDSLNKRISFLEEVIKKLQLEEIEAIHARAEEFGRNKNKRESFDIAVARAVAKLNTLVEYLLPLIKVDGILIAYKGLNSIEELNEAKKAIEILGGKFENSFEYVLPKDKGIRNIIIIRKIKSTPIIYPRDKNLPKLKPIV